MRDPTLALDTAARRTLTTSIVAASVVLGSPEVLKQVLDQDYMTFDREKDLNDIFHDIASGASRSALRSVSSVGSLRPQFGPYPTYQDWCSSSMATATGGAGSWSVRRSTSPTSTW